MNLIEKQKFHEHVMHNLDFEKNQEILFAGAKVGQLEFLSLFRSCMERTGTTVRYVYIFRRVQRALFLARYFDYSLSIKGARIECGALKGFSSLLLSQIARMRNKGFDGSGFHIVDSFEGLSKPTMEDVIYKRKLPNGKEEAVCSHPAGHFATPIEHVQSVMADFPGSSIHKGWIPDVFSSLPEMDWSFVHIDVDLYEPTKSCLEYFLPRLSPGGVIVNDDFDAPLFPGAGLGWHEVMEREGLSYAVLDTGQAVYINQPSSD